MLGQVVSTTPQTQEIEKHWMLKSLKPESTDLLTRSPWKSHPSQPYNGT